MTGILKNWIISLLLVGVASTLVQVLVNGGKSETTVKKCTGIILSLLIIAPLPVILNRSMDFSKALDYVYKSGDAYGEYSKNYIFDILADKIKSNLTESGITDVEVVIDGEGDGVNSKINFVIIKSAQCVIDQNEEHINNRKKIIDAVTAVVSIPEENIIIYE